MAQKVWTAGDAFANADFADEGRIRFTRAAAKQNGMVPPLLVVHHQGRPQPSLILRAVVESGEADAPIYLAPQDYERLNPDDSDGKHVKQHGSIPLAFHPAGRCKAITHPTNRGALGDALVTFVSALLLAVCALANVWFSRKVDTSPVIFPIAIVVAVVAIGLGIWRVWRDIGKLYK